jgi:hypothetical protein
MGLAFPASVECDKCGEKAVIQIALTKLNPSRTCTSSCQRAGRCRAYPKAGGYSSPAQTARRRS